MKKLILLITILAIASTCYASAWRLISQQKVNNGYLCTYSNHGITIGDTKTVFKYGGCPYTID